MQAVSIPDKVAALREHFRPAVAAQANGQELKVVKVLGEFPWHHHADEDEMFLIWDGRIEIHTRENVFTLGRGDCLVVPRGTEHCVVAREECQVLLFEPAGVRNTGNIYDPVYTAPDTEAA